MDPERTPVVVAAAQLKAPERDLSAAELAVEASRAALSSASRLARAIERVSVVNILTRSGGPAPASGIAAALSLSSATRRETTTVGGCTPLWLIGRAAADITAGRLQAALIAGAEAVRSGRLRGQSPAPRDEPEGERDPVIGDDRIGCAEGEIAAGVFVPIYVYPLFESALAARAGRSPAEQRTFAAELMAPFTAVAARNPYAWFPTERTAPELATPAPGNRLVAEPYTKLLTAFLGGSQAAAVVVTSLAVARSLGIAEGAMFVRSVATADDVWFPSARPDLASSPAAGAVAESALAASGLGLDDVDHLDIYSCFPCAVQMSAAACGIALGDDRGLTITGGLPYFGGPGNNYTTHAVATLFELLRERPGSGMLTSVSWFMTKHAAACFSTRPGELGFDAGDTTAEQERIDRSALDLVALGEEIERQTAVVDAATVIYGREAEVTSAPVVATLGDHRRIVAVADPESLAALAGLSLVGEKIDVSGRAGQAPVYRFA